jgi:DNA-binding response OmpR family regulator
MKNKFEIDTATSVKETFNKIKTQTYDAVDSDYEMPLRNGTKFLKQIREENNVAFFFFTF